MNTEMTKSYLIHYHEIDPNVLTPEQLYEQLQDDFTEIKIETK